MYKPKHARPDASFSRIPLLIAILALLLAVAALLSTGTSSHPSHHRHLAPHSTYITPDTSFDVDPYDTYQGPPDGTPVPTTTLDSAPLTTPPPVTLPN